MNRKEFAGAVLAGVKLSDDREAMLDPDMIDGVVKVLGLIGACLKKDGASPEDVLNKAHNWVGPIQAMTLGRNFKKVFGKEKYRLYKDQLKSGLKAAAKNLTLDDVKVILADEPVVEVVAEVVS